MSMHNSDEKSFWTIWFVAGVLSFCINTVAPYKGPISVEQRALISLTGPFGLGAAVFGSFVNLLNKVPR